MNRFMLCVTMTLTLAFFFAHICQISEISAGSKEIQSLRGEIDQLKEDREQLQINLANCQNIDRVKDVAIGVLGMDYPVEGQVQLVSLSNYSSSANTQTAHDGATP